MSIHVTIIINKKLRTKVSRSHPTRVSVNETQKENSIYNENATLGMSNEFEGIYQYNQQILPVLNPLWTNRLNILLSMLAESSSFILVSKVRAVRSRL